MPAQPPSEQIDARPLYQRVRDVLLERIGSGALAPGAPLPNEFQLAAELGVSQGTVRKALDALARDQLVVRQQGRGTFVREQTADDVMFRFFRLFDRRGRQIRPEGGPANAATGPAVQAEARRLGLSGDAEVIRITRVRTSGGVPLIFETIALPAGLFPGLAGIRPVPNTLYDLFQSRYGITVSRVDEQISSVGAGARVAERLAIPRETPLLAIDRTTYALDERIIEWRRSLCHLQGGWYAATLK